MSSEKDLTLKGISEICDSLKSEYGYRYDTSYLFSQWLANLVTAVEDKDVLSELIITFKMIRDIDKREELHRQSDEYDVFLSLFCKLIEHENKYIGSIYKEKNSNTYLVCVYEKGSQLKLYHMGVDRNNDVIINNGLTRFSYSDDIDKDMIYISSYREFLNNPKMRKKVALQIRRAVLESQMHQIDKELDREN